MPVKTSGKRGVWLRSRPTSALKCSPHSARPRSGFLRRFPRRSNAARWSGATPSLLILSLRWLGSARRTVDADIAATAKRIGAALEAAGIEYAIGGALALGIHGALRATRDVAVNIFCEPASLPAALKVLGAAGVTLNEETAQAGAASEGWFSGWLGAVRVDVFVPSIDFSWEAARRRTQRSFAGASLWFLSAESLCIFKLLFFRTKDLADLEQLALTTPLDTAWVKESIASMMGSDDPRVAAWERITSSRSS